MSFLKTLARMASLVLAVSFLAFWMVGASPINPARANVDNATYAALGPEKRAELAAYWGTDSPLWERFLAWLGHAIHGDFGLSLLFNRPVADVLAQRAGGTLVLLFLAWVCSAVIGFALGVAAGVRPGSHLDRAVRGYCFILAATPTFWVALLMLTVFAVTLGWFPVGFSVPVGVDASIVSWGERLYHLALPAITLSLVGVANIALHTREKAIDIMASDFMVFAQARGLSRGEALRRHGLRAMLLPAISLNFANIAEIFGGSVLVETVFSYPGLGQAAVSAGIGGDTALLVGIAVVSALLIAAGNLTADLLYRLVDPRLSPAVTSTKSTSKTRETGESTPTLSEGVPQTEAATASAAAGGAVTTAAAGATVTTVATGITAATETHKTHVVAGFLPASTDAGELTRDATPETIEPTATTTAVKETTRETPGRTVFHTAEARRVPGRRAALFLALSCAALLVAVAVAGGVLFSQAEVSDLANRHLAPSAMHPFGTDQLGRDMWVRTLSGLAVSIGIGLLAAVASSLIAVILAVLAARSRWADRVVTWLIDLTLAVPHLVALILIAFALGRGAAGVIIGVAVTHWPALTRVLRAEIMQVNASVYVGIDRQLGYTPTQIAWRHFLPALFPQFIVGLTLLFPHAIMHEAALTFLGFGLSTETPAMGIILSEAMRYLSVGAWWPAVFPGLALVGVVALFFGLGQGARRLLDPHQAQR